MSPGFNCLVHVVTIFYIFREHSLASVLSSGKIYSFGLNGSGQLGVNSLSPFMTPVPIKGSWVPWKVQQELDTKLLSSDDDFLASSMCDVECSNPSLGCDKKTYEQLGEHDGDGKFMKNESNNAFEDCKLKAGKQTFQTKGYLAETSEHLLETCDSFKDSALVIYSIFSGGDQSFLIAFNEQVINWSSSLNVLKRYKFRTESEDLLTVNLCFSCRVDSLLNGNCRFFFMKKGISNTVLYILWMWSSRINGIFQYEIRI